VSPERRPHMFKSCVFPECDWRVTTSWFVGGPYRTQKVPDKDLEKQIIKHLVDVHGHKVERTIFT